MNRVISWGEFLLQLIPTTTTTTTAAADGEPLSIIEMSSLRTSGLVGDDDWGSARLQVVLPDDNNNNTTTTTTTNNDEISRLTKERHYLLEKLQRMGRTLERRAEGIKGTTTSTTTTNTTTTNTSTNINTTTTSSF